MRRDTISGVDGSFMAEQRARAAQRAQRFALEAAKPPPPLPMHRKTIASGKVSKPKSQADVMTAFLKRKLAAGIIPDDAVLEQARSLGIEVQRLADEVVAEAASDVASPLATGDSGTPTQKSKRGLDLDDELDDYWQAAHSPKARAPVDGTAIAAAVSKRPTAVIDKPLAASLGSARATDEFAHSNHRSSSQSNMNGGSVGDGGSARARGSAKRLAGGNKTSSKSRRWRLPWLLLAHKLSLATSTCRAFCFRKSSRAIIAHRRERRGRVR
mmetsp:Transcript_1891/g.5353  ORF Transcript_1891/g.5353 Transcript_1891/m.5353 type:complete len:270 (+) Transcript_1891:65-874(+)